MGRYVQSNLITGEKVIYEAKLHWRIFISLWGVFTLFVGPLIAYFTNEYAITNKRVIIKAGASSRHTLETDLTKIESIGVSQGILGRILRYGTIRITGTGGTRSRFKYVRAPLEFRRALQEIQSGTSS